jgi:hypothetical protein
VLGCRGETAHGPVFRRVCAERGIDARAAGAPEADPVDSDRARLLDRVTKLFALAASDNQHEAENAATAAQRLMLKYNLENLGRTATHYATRHLGVPTGRVEESQKVLGGILTQFFFVDAIWVSVWRVTEMKYGQVLEIVGRPENVELAEYVHAFLNRAASELWRSYRKHRALRGNADRRSFESGVMTGFREKLVREAARSEGEGLVWAGDRDLKTWYRSRHPHIRTSSSSGPRRGAAYGDGRQAGRTIVLHRGLGEGPSTGAVRLLKG